VVIGPARPWTRSRESFDRAVRTFEVFRPDVPDLPGGCLDTEDHLAALIVTADPQALADLRARVFAPLSGMSEAAAAKLLETLRSWLAHQGRRDEIAAELFVHPQTVRYRMTRLRELYGDRLRDPQWLLLLTVALA
jgi:DNA-binding PucR family transcriptional regulator